MSGQPTIYISEGTKALLFKYKRLKGFKSVDEAIRHCLKVWGGRTKPVPTEVDWENPVVEKVSESTKKALQIACIELGCSKVDEVVREALVYTIRVEFGKGFWRR